MTLAKEKAERKIELERKKEGILIFKYLKKIIYVLKFEKLNEIIKIIRMNYRYLNKKISFSLLVLINFSTQIHLGLLY